MHDDDGGPALRVVKGDPTPGEVAALVAVVGALRSGPGAAARPRSRSAWADRRELLRRAPVPGRPAWLR